MEDVGHMMVGSSIADLLGFYRGKRVLVTGHTGFKGGWLVAWLSGLGSEVTGFALEPESHPNLFEAAQISAGCRHFIGDLRDLARLSSVLEQTRPDIVFHLAAQSLVRRSYTQPVETVESNVLGTVHLLEAIRRANRPCTVVAVTSDKCYENSEWPFAYRENDPLGGHDVYSASKGACEILVSSYRRSFFDPARIDSHGIAVATARAGNVIGGGDWSEDRIVPDCIRALTQRRTVAVRNPSAVRPWQHVLEPLAGYLILGARLSGVGTNRRGSYCEPWNFGPAGQDSRTVASLVDAVVAAWGTGSWESQTSLEAPHEAALLRLGIDKAEARLGWIPRWHFDTAVKNTVAWYRAHWQGAQPKDLRALIHRQIAAYCEGECD